MKLLEFYFYIMFGLLFCRVGFPLMLITTVIAMFYLLICHVAFQWHPTWTCLFVLYTVYNRKGCKFQTVIVFSPKKTPKKTQLTTVKFNWFYVQWIFVASLHFFMISFFVLPQYSKCNACTMLYLCYGFKNESLLFHHLMTFSCLPVITATLQSKLPVHVL